MPLALHRWFPAAKAPGTIDLYALSQAVGKAPKRAESAIRNPEEPPSAYVR
jgi:hypothetical protein